jgi:hypothetical protein
MSPFTPQLTPELQRNIVSFVRAGGYPHIAAEAAGVPQRIFQKWLRRGHGRQAEQPYRGFADEVTQAAAQARLRAEVAIIDKRPLDWLKCGPGKESSHRPGWSAAPRAQAAPRSRDSNPLANPVFQRYCADLMDALTPFPEARAAIADKFPDGVQSRRQRPQNGRL